MLQRLARCLTVCSFLSIFFVPAVAFAAFTASPTSGTAPLTVQFSNTVAGPLPGPVTINYGDGSSEAIAPCTGGSSAAPVKCATPGVNTHTYSSPGTYVAKLISTTYTCQGATIGAPQGCPVQTMLGTATTTVAARTTTTPATTPASTPTPTCTLTASATSVPLGNTTNLKWTSTNSTGGTITGIGTVGASGIQGVIPTGSGTTYTGTFLGANGKTATCSLRITVQSGGGFVPTSPTYDATSNSYYDPTTDSYYKPSSSYTPSLYYKPDASYTPNLYYNPTLNAYYDSTTNTVVQGSGSVSGGSAQSVTNIPAQSSGLVSCGVTSGDAAGNYLDATQCNLCHLGQLIQNIINYMLALAVPISVALFAYVGVLYFGSAANPAGIEKAKGIFKTTFIGLAVAIAAYLIVQVLLSALLDQSFLNLNNWRTLTCSSKKRPRDKKVSDIFSEWKTTPSQTQTGFSCPTGSTQTGVGLCSGNNGFVSPTGHSCSSGTFDPNTGGCVDANGNFVVAPTPPIGASVPQLNAACPTDAITAAWGANASKFQCIANNESGCNPGAQSGVDKTANGTGPAFSVGLYQTNLISTNFNIPQCITAAQTAGYNTMSGSLDCKAAFAPPVDPKAKVTVKLSNGTSFTGSAGAGYGYTVSNQNLYNACVAAASNVACNTAAAQALYAAGGFKPWKNDINKNACGI